MSRPGRPESDVTREAIRLHKEGKSPAVIRDTINSIYGTNYSREHIRDRIRKHGKYEGAKRAEEKPLASDTVYDAFLKLIARKQSTIAEISSELNNPQRISP